MKNHPSLSSPSPFRLLCRLVTSAFALLLLTMTVSCGGGKSEDHEAVMQALSVVNALEIRVNDIQQQITETQVLSGRVRFWQSVAMTFIVISLVALVGGSALGSRARQENAEFRQRRSERVSQESPVALKSPNRSLNHV